MITKKTQAAADAGNRKLVLHPMAGEEKDRAALQE